MEANNVEKRFNDWFTVSYDRLRNLVGRYGALDEDNFHDTYLFVRKQVLNPEREITDYEAYFIGCYRKAFMAKFRLESKYAHPDEYFFLRCGEDADFLSPDDLNSCEKLVNAQEIRMPTHGQSMYNSINGRLWKRTMWKKGSMNGLRFLMTG